MTTRFAVPTSASDSRDLPVSLADLKAQLRIDHSDHDSLLTAKIAAATNEAEEHIGVPIIHRSLTLVLDGFPSGTDGIALNHRPVGSVTAITYYDAAGDSQTLASSGYVLLTALASPEIRLAPSAAWPSTQTREDAVSVEYVAGYAATAADVPPAIREAITLRAATRYEMAEEFGVGGSAWKLDDSLAFKTLLNTYRNLST